MLGGINGTTTLSKDARVELREVKRYAGLCARAPGMAVSAIAMCAAGRRPTARGLPGVGKQGNKPSPLWVPEGLSRTVFLRPHLCCRFFPRVHPRCPLPHHLVGTSGLVTTRST